MAFASLCRTKIFFLDFYLWRVLYVNFTKVNVLFKILIFLPIVYLGNNTKHDFICQVEQLCEILPEIIRYERSFY